MLTRGYDVAALSYQPYQTPTAIKTQGVTRSKRCKRGLQQSTGFDTMVNKTYWSGVLAVGFLALCVCGGELNVCTFQGSVLGPNVEREKLGQFSDTKVNGELRPDLTVPEGCEFQVVDDSFRSVIGANPKLAILASKDFNFAHEGGAYVEKTGEVFFTSNRLGDTSGVDQFVDIYKVALSNGNVTKVIPKTPIPMANGLSLDGDGKLLVCSQGSGSVGGSIVRLDLDTYDVETVVDNWFGLNFNSPNDVVATEDGSVWFTDPSYGYEQNFRTKPELGEFVWRVDASTRVAKVVADGFIKPNGLAFSPNETVLYISDTGFFEGAGSFDRLRPHTVYAFDVEKKSTGEVAVQNRRVFAVTDSKIPDGLKLDAVGNVYVGAGDGVVVFSPEGTLLGKILVASGVANLAFAGNTLVMLAETDIYTAELNVMGV